jgi:hypothetical protein
MRRADGRRARIDGLDASDDGVPAFVEVNASRCGPVASGQHDDELTSCDLQA